MVEYRILGPVEIADNTGSLPLGGQKQRALLALLLLNTGSVVSTDQLVDRLWGEHPPKTAVTSLQNLVSQLRKLLGADVLLTKPPGYMLKVECDQIDLGRFEGLVAKALGREPEKRAELLREALSLWRGPPLADLAFEEFAQVEIRRLEELRLEALEERIDADLALGSGSELAPELERLAAEHPARERFCRQLMLALYRAGRQAEALQVYLDTRRALVDELGIEPSLALQQLYRSILRQDVVLERTPPTVAAGDHFGEVAKALLGGRLVVVLGEGINGAPGSNGDGLPSSEAVVAHLARTFDCPSEQARDLPHIAEYVALTQGLGPLYDELHDLFGREYGPGGVHRSLAAFAGALRERGAPHQLIVTTSFDETLERAFEEAGEEFDVVSHLAVGRYFGKFLHVAPGGAATLVDVPNAYADLSLERRTVILKILGGVDRAPERRWESFVVSEDDHIDYLAQADLTATFPVTVAARLRRSHFLFLGYPLRDWSLRVFLRRVWGREKVSYASWAVGSASDVIEQRLWRERGVEIVDATLEEYTAGIADRLRAEVSV